MDETYIPVRGQWKYLYRAMDRAGNTIDFLLRAQRDKAAARRFFERCARILLGGIELMHMVAKGQMQRSGRATASVAQHSIPWPHEPTITAGFLSTDRSYCVAQNKFVTGVSGWNPCRTKVAENESSILSTLET